MTYTKIDIWNDLSQLQATCWTDGEWQKEVRKIMKKISKDCHFELSLISGLSEVPLGIWETSAEVS